jgi:protein TonB
MAQDAGMSRALFTCPGTWRGGMFGFVACAHALFLTALSLAKVPEPSINDKVVVVELLSMAPGSPVTKVEKPERPAVQPVVEPPPMPVKKRPVRTRKAISIVKAPPSPAIIEETISEVLPGVDAATPALVVVAPVVFGRAAPGNTSSAGDLVENGVPGGSGDSSASFDADYLRNPKPPYPPLSRRIREEGRVVLRVRVTAEGSAGDVEVRTSSGSSRLDESALRTVRRWKFIPARHGRAPVQSWVLVPIIFKLES